MQQVPLLRTKLYIPPMRPELVPRPRLMERLDAGLHRKLTLVSAPAGFGKTTLVGEWVDGLRRSAANESQAGNEIAWLSLDENDNEPSRFLAYLVAALQMVAADVGQGALSALQSPRPPPADAILPWLINDIAALSDKIVLVLDDYHLIQAQPIHDALTVLLEHLPPQMHLVIATRDDPHVPLARLRARGQLSELRAADLRFSLSEAAEFLHRTMGLDLSAEDIAALETRTEGWIAGLQLAALSMRGRQEPSGLVKSFTGSHRFVLDYLIGEVLEQQSETVQTFLLQTAILDRLSGSLCDAVRFGEAKSPSTPGGDAVRFGTAKSPSTPGGDAVRFRSTQAPDGQDDSRSTLEMLDRANLFVVPLDDERRWYRYHHLFADLLRRRLRQEHPDWVPALHHRASEWYGENGFADRAIDHALHAADFERAAQLIQERFDAVYRRGEHATLRRWLAALPDELVFSRPQLCFFHAWNLFSSGQLDAAEKTLQAAEIAFGSGADRANQTPSTGWDELSGADRTTLMGRAAAMRAYLALYRGDVEGTMRYARLSLDNLPDRDLTWRSTAAIALGDALDISGETEAAYQARSDAIVTSKRTGDPYLSLIVNLKVVATLRQQGKLEQVREICQQQFQLAQERGISQTVVAGWLLAMWGEVLAEFADLEGAKDRALEGVELAERGNDVVMAGWSTLCLIRALFSAGDMAGATNVVQKMENIAQEFDVPPWIANRVAAWQARIWLTQDRVDFASHWANQRGLDAGQNPTYPHEMEYIALARILIAQERLDEAGTLLQRLLDAAEANGRISSAIEILALQALAFQAGGDLDRALATLGRSFTLAEPGGFVRIFVDEGPPMALLLYEAAARGVAPAYTRRLLAAFPITEAVQPGPSETQAPSSELIEPLSERELQVLRLVADGLTNQEIASRLFLSLNTVKSHTRNIHGKLIVHSRTRAVARARQLGLLPPR
jgi:LuxR family maltose regulon positive regulatory protein